MGMRFRGEFNNASARRALVEWYLSLFITCKAGHQCNERPRALALLNLPQVNGPLSFYGGNIPYGVHIRLLKRPPGV